MSTRTRYYCPEHTCSFTFEHVDGGDPKVTERALSDHIRSEHLTAGELGVDERDTMVKWVKEKLAEEKRERAVSYDIELLLGIIELLAEGSLASGLEQLDDAIPRVEDGELARRLLEVQTLARAVLRHL